MVDISLGSGTDDADISPLNVPPPYVAVAESMTSSGPLSSSSTPSFSISAPTPSPIANAIDKAKELVHSLRSPSRARSSSRASTSSSDGYSGGNGNNSLSGPAMLDSSWADGLRGLASLFVVSSHIVLCFARRLVLPCCGPGPGGENHPAIFQLPIFRLVAAGHSWVALFFILSGFVNALKPIKMARAGRTDVALSSLALSSFRRSFRLVLPASAATVLSWFVCQLGAYETSRNADAYWLYTYTPPMSQSWGTALEDLVAALRATWTLGSINPYDQPQWALIYLLQGSMMVFVALLITVPLSPGWRASALGLFAAWSFDWSYKTRDPLVGFTVFAGVILSEISLSSIPIRLASLSPILSPPLAFAGLVFMSFPSDRPHLSPWSKVLDDIGNKHFPPSGELARVWGALGCTLLVFAILISPHLRRLLSRSPLLWLGKVSFPIYLLHGTFLRSLMAWLEFWGRPLKGFDVPGATAQADGKVPQVFRYAQPGAARTWFAIVASTACMLVAAHYWAKRVEPVFARITKRVEDAMVFKPEDIEGGGASGICGMARSRSRSGHSSSGLGSPKLPGGYPLRKE